ncbi:Sensor histidine kinase RcsC [subsurface metagenome]
MRVINSNTNRVLSLIQQLFDFRKVETSHWELSYEKIDIKEFFQYFTDSFIEKIEENNIDFIIESYRSTIIWNTDRDKLEKIIFNLISNAIKYTPKKGTIKISYKAEAGLLRINIYNSGYGISDEDIAKIFDRFGILKLSEDSFTGSPSFRSGIGLAITKGLVELLKGSIKVNREVNVFTEFEIAIPYASLDIIEIKKNSDPVSEDEKLVSNKIEYPDQKSISTNDPDLNNKQLILVIDDKEEIRSLVKDILIEPYDVIEASSADNADIILQEKQPDLIICDILMPGTDGLTFSKKLKENFNTSHIPLILLTALQSVEKKIEGLSVGADDFITKPFHPTHLLVRIENLLSNKSKLKEFFDFSIDNHNIPTGLQIGERDKELIRKVTSIIENNIDNPELNPNFICEEISMSRMQFYRKLKGLVQQSPSEFVRNVKLKYAARYLINTELSVLEILYQSGFNNKSYFYREFNNFFKCSPLEYREKNSEA